MLVQVPRCNRCHASHLRHAPLPQPQQLAVETARVHNLQITDGEVKQEQLVGSRIILDIGQWVSLPCITPNQGSG